MKLAEQLLEKLNIEINEKEDGKNDAKPDAKLVKDVDARLERMDMKFKKKATKFGPVDYKNEKAKMTLRLFKNKVSVTEDDNKKIIKEYKVKDWIDAFSFVFVSRGN